MIFQSGLNLKIGGPETRINTGFITKTPLMSKPWGQISLVFSLKLIQHHTYIYKVSLLNILQEAFHLLFVFLIFLIW